MKNEKLPAHMKWVVVFLITGMCGILSAFCQAPPDAGGAMAIKPLSELSDRSISRLGERALAIRSSAWKHGETANFIYHFFQESLARPVASETEFYYRVIAKELERDTSRWERKAHIYVFEEDADWNFFKSTTGVEAWSGGICAQGELFIQRDAHRKFKGNGLAHELTHLIIFRFYGSGVPLWLNEGLAEYTATRWYASFWRSRGYNARPVSSSVSASAYIPLKELTSALAYPPKAESVISFYNESERLVRFLSAIDKHKFAEFLELMSKGSRFESAIDRTFGTKFLNVEALEAQFKPYASKDSEPN